MTKNDAARKLPHVVFSVLFYLFVCVFAPKNLIIGFSGYTDGCFGADYKTAVALTVPSVTVLLVCAYVFMSDLVLSLADRSKKSAAQTAFDLVFTLVPVLWFLFTGWSYKSTQTGGFFDATVIPAVLICLAALVFSQVRGLKSSGFDREKKSLTVFRAVFFACIFVFGGLFFELILLFAALFAEPGFRSAAAFPAIITAFVCAFSVISGRITSRQSEGNLRYALDKALIVLLAVSYLWFVLYSLTPVGVLLKDTGFTYFDGFIFTFPVQALILLIRQFSSSGAPVTASKEKPAPLSEAAG